MIVIEGKIAIEMLDLWNKLLVLPKSKKTVLVNGWNWRTSC
jgi:hypothetical protein